MQMSAVILGVNISIPNIIPVTYNVLETLFLDVPSKLGDKTSSLQVSPGF